ncbi:MAG: 16S rRNA (guanine(527)-N(7))-methyltransferase RsmG [Pseudomonadota bacterium]
MKNPSLSAITAKEAVQRRVSRETFERMEAYEALLIKWQRSINLISKASISDIWNRHILDSLQLTDHAPEDPNFWVDLGSGAGLPGLICAVALTEKSPQTEFTLIEVDQRKCVFLAEASRALGISVNIVRQRIEDVDSLQADVVSARALAPLDLLCSYASRHLSPGGICLFLKGKSLQDEVDQADKSWRMQRELIASRSDPEGVIVRIKDLQHAGN